jgi:hypothetical protein
MKFPAHVDDIIIKSVITSIDKNLSRYCVN